MSSSSSSSSSFSSKSSSTFSAAEDDAMIARIRENGVLFDASHSMYKDGMHKDYIWHQIGTAVGRTPDECKKRWQNMRNTYKKRKKRSLTQSPPKKQWQLMGRLSFLDSAERDKKAAPNAKTPAKGLVAAAGEAAAIGERGEEAAARAGKRRRDDDAPTVTAAKPSPDSVDLFFSSVALNVKRLPTRAINKAQMKVLSLVAQLEDEYAHPAPFLHHLPPAGYRYTDYGRARWPGPTSVPPQRQDPPFGTDSLCVAYDVFAPK